MCRAVAHDSWERSICGAYPVVPEFLAGVPNPMRRRVQVASDKTPVRIIIDLNSSMSVSADVLLKRGLAVLALAMGLAQERAVELWGLVSLARVNENTDDQAGIMWCIACSGEPLDLSRVAASLASPAFCRGAGYALCCEHLRANVTCRGLGGRDGDRHERQAREALGLTPDDVFIRPVDASDPLVTRPVEFIQKQLADIAARER